MDIWLVRAKWIMTNDVVESVFNQPFTRDDFVSDPSQTLPGRLTCLIKNGLWSNITVRVRVKILAF